MKRGEYGKGKGSKMIVTKISDNVLEIDITEERKIK